MRTAQLKAAYANTRYQVQAGPHTLYFRIGCHDAAQDALLTSSLGTWRNWAIITPCNPASVALCAHENEARLEHFRQQLVSLGYRWLPSLNRDPDSAWPDEAGALVLDISLPAAQALGREYDQYAIVFAQNHKAPRLIWLGAAA